MKKRIFRLLALCLTLLLLCPFPQAEAAGASLSGSSSLRAGNSVTLTFSVSANKAYAVQAELSYDSSKLSLIGTEQLIGGSWSMDMNGNTVVLSDNRLNSPIKGSESVFSVTFQAKSGLSAGTNVSAAVKNISLSDGESDISVGSASWSATIAAPLSSNAALESLSCSDAALTPSFSPDTTNYSVTVPYSVSALSLHYSTDDDDADSSLSGNSLSVGENTITITVTAEDGSSRRYTIIATREQDPEYVASKNAALSALKASAGTLSPVFQSAVTDYVIYLPFETETITLSGTAQDGKALSVKGVSDAKLTVGDNLLQVSCTAEDGTTIQNYQVHVWRMPQYAGKLPQIIPDQEEQPAQQTGIFAALWESLCAEVTIPFVSSYIGAIPLYALAAAALLILLLVLYLLGTLVGKRVGRRRALLDWNEQMDMDDGYSDEDFVPMVHRDEPEERDASILPEPIASAVPLPEEPAGAQEEESAPELAVPAAPWPAAEAPAKEEANPDVVVYKSPSNTLKDLEGMSLDELLTDIKNM